MWELDYTGGWMPNNWCFLTVMLEKILTVRWTAKRSNPVNPKGDRSWIFIGRTDAEAEAPILWPPNVKSQLIDAGKDWRQEQKGTTEDEMVAWHHQLNGRQFEQTLGRWWWTGKPGMLQSMESWKVEYDLATEQWQHTLCVCLLPIVTHDHWHQSPNPCSLVVNGIWFWG